VFFWGCDTFAREEMLSWIRNENDEFKSEENSGANKGALI
jgi:hypothetical protein